MTHDYLSSSIDTIVSKCRNHLARSPLARYIGWVCELSGFKPGQQDLSSKPLATGGSSSKGGTNPHLHLLVIPTPHLGYRGGPVKDLVEARVARTNGHSGRLSFQGMGLLEGATTSTNVYV